MSGGKSTTHDNRIKALVGGVLVAQGYEVHWFPEDNDWREIMNIFRYCRRLRQIYAQGRNLGTIHVQ